MVIKVAVLLHSMMGLCIFTQTINPTNATNNTSTSTNNASTFIPSSKTISTTTITSVPPTVTSTTSSQNRSNTTVGIETTSTTVNKTPSPRTTALSTTKTTSSITTPSTAKTTSSITTPKLTSSPSTDATTNVYFTTSVATNGTLSSSSRSSTHGQASSAATSFVGSPSTTVVMPTVIPSWTNWTTKVDCKEKCCGIGGTVTQYRACTKGSITLTSPNPCDGNSTKIVTCDEGCPQCSSGLMLMTERLVAVGCVVLGLVIKLLYAG